MSTSESFRISDQRPIATGFDFEPLPSGDVLIINTQVITRDGLARLPVVVHAFFLAVEEGPDAALAFMNGVTAREGDRHAE